MTFLSDLNTEKVVNHLYAYNILKTKLLTTKFKKMNIKEFKDGDIITRNEPSTHENGNSDYALTGDRMTFKGIDEDAKMIFLVSDTGEVITLSYVNCNWHKGWHYYPETLFQKIKNGLKNLKK